MLSVTALMLPLSKQWGHVYLVKVVGGYLRLLLRRERIKELIFSKHAVPNG